MQGRTTLVLAHRLSSVVDCDSIVVIDDGLAVETGSHDALMAADGVYAALMQEQVRESHATRDDSSLISRPDRPATETLDTTPGGARYVPTEG